MPKRTISMMPAARDAARVLGQQIRVARQARRWTMESAAARVGVSPTTYAAIEAGAPGTSIGTVLNAAVLVGVPLFRTTDPAELARMRFRGDEREALVTSRVYRPASDPPDDF